MIFYAPQTIISGIGEAALMSLKTPNVELRKEQKMSSMDDKTLDIYALKHRAKAEAERDESPGVTNVRLISRLELKEKLDRGDDFKVVMTYHQWAYKTKHIPGSINIHAREDALAVLDPADEIVVNCTNEACNASLKAYKFLVSHGFKNVRRYAGGLLDWEQAGYRLVGDQA
jgi:rhodanese-related sulfurtransferase